ncbi:hypothetical protein ACIP97_13425 [Peribacillus frigoritolerans]|uniref:hypothetical protein n=1 Tax=Peribacillus frigoritolerans TaxID=450367 RepID=UPI0037F89381
MSYLASIQVRKSKNLFLFPNFEEYEFQFGITGNDGFHISNWPRDVSGNLLPTKRVLTAELQEISTLTTLP